ncbi:MAG: tRNA (5-methylaminomethyl-2-thiouridine)(34)-methyltransferase MnmD [Chlorobi bacterium]|nr:tRNA (5-methylaminomethyl-2-thiouridine)(34)-methyltransferase MnmD [Chlorobiota bacterium]
MKEKFPVRIISTAEGSHTLFRPDIREVYHSRHGAVRESMHVFIQQGYKQLQKDPVYIFEAGFGTGLNALLTCMEAIHTEIHTVYDAIELYPLEWQLLNKLNYPDILNDTGKLFYKIHQAPWDKESVISPWFALRKIQENLRTFLPDRNYDLIYFDAFAPEIQPEVWDPQVFITLAGSLNPGGILVTYSAKSSIRKAMQSAGLVTECLPGPPGKREMTRARKSL